LEGCPDREAIIRCTFVTNTSIPVPHAHRLGGKENSNKDNGNEGEYQEIVVSAKNEWTATYDVFSIKMLRMAIINISKYFCLKVSPV
jgi:hypothetical protein